MASKFTTKHYKEVSDIFAHMHTWVDGFAEDDESTSWVVLECALINFRDMFKLDNPKFNAAQFDRDSGRRTYNFKDIQN